MMSLIVWLLQLNVCTRADKKYNILSLLQGEQSKEILFNSEVGHEERTDEIPSYRNTDKKLPGWGDLP